MCVPADAHYIGAHARTLCVAQVVGSNKTNSRQNPAINQKQWHIEKCLSKSIYSNKAHMKKDLIVESIEWEARVAAIILFRAVTNLFRTLMRFQVTSKFVGKWEKMSVLVFPEGMNEF